nr:hypothetical protein [Tanacetum cinerariifolium]
MSKDVEPSKKNLEEDMERLLNHPLSRLIRRTGLRNLKDLLLLILNGTHAKQLMMDLLRISLVILPKQKRPFKTFNELMSTLIDFTVFALNRLQISDLTKAYLKRLEDLQLGVENYQKKLNLSKPRTSDEDLSRRAPYTTLSDPQDVIYEDKLNRKRLMRSDELYKFCDGTLKSVRDTRHDMETNLRMGYNKAMPRRRWGNLDKIQFYIMVKDIDRQLLERRLMRSLEKLIGEREYGKDLRLLQQTI